jgi:hypothetical protein
MKTPRNNEAKTRGRPFQPGNAGRFQPGNAGRPKGARHKVSLAVEALLDGEAEGLTRKAIQLGLAGDLTALRLCMDRIAPPRKDRPVPFSAPTITTAADAAVAAAAIVQAVADGELTPSEAAELTKIIEGYARILEVADHEERLKRLEANMGRT